MSLLNQWNLYEDEQFWHQCVTAMYLVAKEKIDDDNLFNDAYAKTILGQEPESLKHYALAIAVDKNIDKNCTDEEILKVVRNMWDTLSGASAMGGVRDIGGQEFNRIQSGPQLLENTE